MAATLREAHALVTASEYETFCVPIAEAWLSGRPVIAPDDTPLRGYFTEHSGLLYPNGDEDALARAMVEFAGRAATYRPQDIIATAAPFTETSVIDAAITRLAAATATATATNN